MSQTVRHLYEFGPFRLDATERLLLRDEQHVPLTPKAFETLLVLVEHGGHVIDKDELMKKVWPNTFVEEVNLAKNVSSLRKILGHEHSENYIETIPKRGYRFVAGVREVWAEEPAPTIADRDMLSPHVTPDALDTGQIEATAHGNGKPAFASAELSNARPAEVVLVPKQSLVTRLGLPIVFLALGGAVVGLGIWFFVLLPTPKPPTPLLKIVPVTSLPGNEDQAAFSPDGNQIAFV